MKKLIGEDLLKKSNKKAVLRLSAFQAAKAYLFYCSNKLKNDDLNRGDKKNGNY